MNDEITKQVLIDNDYFVNFLTEKEKDLIKDIKTPTEFISALGQVRANQIVFNHNFDQ